MSQWVKAAAIACAAFMAASCAAAQEATSPRAREPFPLVAAPEGSPVARHGALSVRGNQIVDQHGEPVTLRGMSLFWSQWMPQYYNADAIAWLRSDWDITVVRAAIAVPGGGYLQNPEREMQKAEAVIEAAIAQGIYVIVDWHAHQPATPQAEQFFDAVAARYGAHPNVIYEIWNEPLNTHDWARDIKPHHEAVIPRIRAHDPDNIIVAGTSTWSQDVDIAAADPLEGPNIAYGLHFYAGTHHEALREKARVALSRGVALMVTEYGTTEATGDGPIDLVETQRWWDFMEEHNLSYVNWSIADKNEASAALRPGAAGTGGWSEDELTPSGRMIRDRIRTMNAED